MATLYKIIAASHWRAAEHDGVFRGSADDLRDGSSWRVAWIARDAGS